MEKFEFQHDPDEKLDQFRQLEYLASIQCTQSEIAAFFQISLDTFKRRLNDQEGIRERWERGADLGKQEIRRRQFEVARGGNVAMLIWLGKQWLGQSEKHDLSSGGQPFKFTIKLNENPDDRD